MNQYLRNVTLWLRGFIWLWDDSRIRYKPGWGPWRIARSAMPWRAGR